MWRKKFFRFALDVRGKTAGILSTLKDRLDRRQPLKGRFPRMVQQNALACKGFSRPATATVPVSMDPISATASDTGWRRRALRGPFRVVTDIDDTVKSSGGIKFLGVALGGIDKRLNRGIFYPGAVQFSYEISCYGGPFVADVSPASVAVLTARARELKFVLALRPKGKIFSKYRATGTSSGHPDWGVGHVYYGSVVEWIFQNRKGIRKFKNFEKLVEEDIAAGNKYQYVLIGDTGEKDEDAAERIVCKYSDQVKAIFLHAVTRAGSDDAPPLEDRVVNGVYFYYFRTYVGAAVKAFHHGMLDKDGLRRILDQSKIDIETMMSSPVTKFRIKMKRKYPILQKEIKEDILLAEEIIKKEDAISNYMKIL